MEIYVVISRYKGRTDFTSVKVSQECYKELEDAVNFCESRLTEEEILENKKAKNRNLKHWFEYDSKDYYYEIRILNLVQEYSYTIFLDFKFSKNKNFKILEIQIFRNLDFQIFKIQIFRITKKYGAF